MYDKLIPKVTNLDTSGFVLPTKYDTDKSEFEKRNFVIPVGLLRN